jgi:hypothetical protein
MFMSAMFGDFANFRQKMAIFGKKWRFSEKMAIFGKKMAIFGK